MALLAPLNPTGLIASQTENQKKDPINTISNIDRKCTTFEYNLRYKQKIYTSFEIRSGVESNQNMGVQVVNTY